MATENTRLNEKVKARQYCYGFRNPVEWGFSIFNICHIVKNLWHYIIYFFRHRASRPTSEELQKHLPEATGQLEKLKTPPPKGIQVLWIGHASLLVQIDGINILTDPVFHDCGPAICGRRYFNYKRFRPPAVTADILNNLEVKIDAVLISHNHFDHLDEESVSDLVKFYGGSDIKWYVPKGMEPWFESRGCENVVAMNWWEERTQDVGQSTKSTKFACTPAKHWSGRNLRYYYCRHLWCSWFIRGPEGSTFFFAGDTGYAEGLFPTIKKAYGAPDVAAIPIGACEPRSVMKAQHINPEEAVMVHRDLLAKASVGIHWGTYALSNEKIGEVKERLKDAKTTDRDQSFITMDHGEVRTFPTDESKDSERKEK